MTRDPRARRFRSTAPRLASEYTPPPQLFRAPRAGTTSACAARVPATPFRSRRRRDRHNEIIDPGQSIDHICEFAKIQLAVAANRQKMKPRGRGRGE
jgi:hypothetical protein